MNLSASAWQIKRSAAREWINWELFRPTGFTADVCTIIAIIEQVSNGIIIDCTYACTDRNFNVGRQRLFQVQKQFRKKVLITH